MKPRTVKNKINQMVIWYGGRRGVAEALGIELSYVYKLEKGYVPGLHLYMAIKQSKRP